MHKFNLFVSLGYYGRPVLLGFGALFLATAAHAAVLVFNDSGSFTEGASGDGTDLSSFTISIPDGSQFTVDVGNDPTILELTWSGAGSWTGSEDILGEGLIDLLSLGDPIQANPLAFTANLGYISLFGDTATSMSGGGSGYIGFTTPLGNEGWMAISYNPTTGFFTYNGGAVADDGSEMTAGVIPEPAHYAGAFGLLALLAAWRRRLA